MRIRSVLNQGLIGILFMTSLAQAESPLATQLRTLRNSLPINDPSRAQLTLRLADVLFNEALKGRTDLDSKGLPADAALKRIQIEAAALYETSLKGEEGRKIVPQGDDRLKIQFQRARLFQDMGDIKQATALYIEVEKSANMVALKRESTLRLAEIKEQANPHSKEVEEAYKKTLELCQGTDLCSYAHYRLAWYYRNQGDSRADLAHAIAEMKLGLYDSKGNIREESLRDLIVFTGVDGTDGSAALAEFDDISTKLNRPQILDQVADSYFGAGNKKAGIKVLDLIHARRPQLHYGIRLLEENYGQRNWSAVQALLTQLQSPELMAQMPNSTDLQRSESEKILKRLGIQLDQERSQNADHRPIFQGVIDLYLACYPNSVDRLKIMEGWLTSESSAAVQRQKIASWVANTTMALNADEKIRLHELAISTAQKEKNQDETIAQADSLIAVAQSAPKHASKVREYQYFKARALYEKKDFAAALPMFVSLAATDGMKEPDATAVQSQNLALDIYNQQKNYAALKAQAETWTKNTKLEKFAGSKKELAEMHQVAEQAEFQMFAGLGETPEALAQFLAFCQAGKFKPQSCQNAKVLAVKQQNQEALIAVLRIEGNSDALAPELEAAGFFKEAADLMAKSAKTVREQMKVALLYELAGDEASHTKMLTAILKSPALKKSFAEDEAPLFALISGSDLVQPSLLLLGWSPKMKEKIADELEVAGRSNALSRKILTSSKESTGRGWATVTLAEFKALWMKERGITFYGKNSKAMFDKRMAAMKALSSFADKNLNGSDLYTRFIMLNAMAKSYQGLSMAILDSPIPAELDAEQSASLKQTLSDLATPFAERAGHFEELFNEQVKKAANAEAETFAKTLFDAKEVSFDLPAPKTATVASSAIKNEMSEGFLITLHKKPTDRAALQSLKDFYASNGRPRLSAYFQGRLMSMNSPEASAASATESQEKKQ